LKKQPSDECHRYCARFHQTKRAHAELAKKIRKCDVAVKKIGFAWSDNIRGEPCKCACWLRR
jgi:hypothetical protein